MKVGMSAVAVAALLLGAGCDSGTSEPKTVQLTPTSPSTSSGGSSALTAPASDSPAENTQLATLRPTLTVRNATSSQSGARIYEFQVSDNSNLTVGGGAVSAYFSVGVNKTGVPEEQGGKTNFTVDTDLQPATKMYWRARASQGGVTSAWSSTTMFKTKIVGYNKPGELYDPLVLGETVGERVGQTTFIPDKGLQIDSSSGMIRYLLPQPVTAGEFSMDVEGLRANAPGDKGKVFSMQEGTSNFTDNRYRVDIQYRGTTGVPPNAITWRVLYGSATDTSVRYEPDTATRFASVFLLNPATKYHWKATWGSDFRLVVLEGGVAGSNLYNYGLPTPKGSYSPNPHYAYLGAPVATSGVESASVAGAVYSNVWLGAKPRPATIGSALER